MSTATFGYDEIMGRVRAAELIDPIRAAFLGPIIAPPRHHHTIDVPGKAQATLLLMPAWMPGEVIGVKIVTIHPGNAGSAVPTVNACYLLLSAATGAPVAQLDGRALTLLRTAAVSALACRLLARPDARRLLIVGTGALAPQLAHGHAAARELDAVAIWGRDPAKAQLLAQRLTREGLPATATSELAAAAAVADIISCATLSSAPLVRGAWLRPGTHVDLVGAFRPDMRESDSQLLARAYVVVDSERAIEESGDLVRPLAEGVIARSEIRTLAEVVGRGDPMIADLSVFKSVGTAVSDLAAASAIAHILAPTA
jgi:ornithine cyclodeaminase/alanine dehydrogenase-like protein (mu-crystallin family)